MNKKYFDDFVITKNNFFSNPEKVISLFNHQKFYSAENYPGKRTENLLESKNEEVRQFALYFAEKLAKEIFIGICRFMIDIRFHINSVYENDQVNQGWIHADDTDLAGVIYLTPDEIDFDSGTSIFLKNTQENFAVNDYKSRQEFNFTEKITDEYLNDLDNNHAMFTESIRVGNLYNRLVAYDSKLFHRPNQYKLLSGNSRQTLVFFIKNYNVEHSHSIRLNSSWEDL
jgi:hypothetical protein